jgi:hypothetical protein
MVGITHILISCYEGSSYKRNYFGQHPKNFIRHRLIIVWTSLRQNTDLHVTELANKCMNLYENGIKLWHRVMKSNIKRFWKRIRSHHFLLAHRVFGYRTMQAAYHSSCPFRILRLCLACGSSCRWNREERSVYVGASDCPKKMGSG